LSEWGFLPLSCAGRDSPGLKLWEEKELYEQKEEMKEEGEQMLKEEDLLHII